MAGISKTHQTYHELRRQITSGEIPANSQLVEEQLCAKLNVSRTPLRTAMRQLADEGYITLNHNRSAIVQSCTLEDLLQVFEVSAYVDASIASHLCELSADGLLDKHAAEKLYFYQKEMEEALERKDLAAWAENDAHFHSLLIDLCQNPYLARVSRPLRVQLERGLWFYTLKVVDLKASTAEHTELLKSIFDGNIKSAQRIAYRHCKRAQKELSSIIKK